MIDLSNQPTLQEIQILPCWEKGEQIIHAESAGESNMNLVLRIQTTNRIVILKQSKPYVRKYPQIPAPIDRIEVEATFLSLLSNDINLAKLTPSILHFDKENHLFLASDLGKGSDFSGIYSGTQNLKTEELIQLVTFLNKLHEIIPEKFPENRDMRLLNHEHLFRFPFLEENGFNLDQVQEGLQDLSLPYKTDSKLKNRLEKLGKRYLSTGDTLIHGDFYPGSWLKVSDGIKVIDPEFGFVGDREFDLGVFMAHLDLSNPDEELIKVILEQYEHPFEFQLANHYRGMEILRRLIGIAQLPLQLSLEQKSKLLEKAKELILNL
ncbi:MAG: phosphotransferase [Algoriphagus sp.]|nr:phosphotransferase [Algoriphagus sp.]